MTERKSERTDLTATLDLVENIDLDQKTLMEIHRLVETDPRREASSIVLIDQEIDAEGRVNLDYWTFSKLGGRIGRYNADATFSGRTLLGATGKFIEY